MAEEGTTPQEGTEVMAKDVAKANVAPKSKYDVTMETVNGLLAEYVKLMDPKGNAPSDEDGIKQQQAFLKVIKMVLRLEGQDFHKGYEELLQWVLKNLDGVMGPRWRNRYMDLLKTMPVMDLRLLEAMLHLMTTTCDGRGRGLAVSRYNFGRLEKCVNDVRQVERLQGFYAQYQ